MFRAFIGKIQGTCYMFTRPIRPNQNASVDPLAVRPTAPGHWPGLCVNLHSGKEDLIGSAKPPPGSRVHSVLVSHGQGPPPPGLGRLSRKAFWSGWARMPAFRYKLWSPRATLSSEVGIQMFPTGHARAPFLPLPVVMNQMFTTPSTLKPRPPASWRLEMASRGHEGGAS